MEFSFIIPVYNRTAKSIRCLRSLMALKTGNTEFIVVDDGSTGETHTAVSELISNDSRFLLITQEHSGVSKARNTGIGRASGKFILFVDSDDYIYAKDMDLLLSRINYDDELIYEQCRSELIEYYNIAINKVFARREKYITDKDLLRKKLKDDAVILQKYMDLCKTIQEKNIIVPNAGI